MDQYEAPSVSYNFNQEIQLKFGERLYLTGSLHQLGLWNPLKAIPLNCVLQKFWIAKVKIPFCTQFQYKYFVGSYELTEKGLPDIRWIGHKNETLIIEENYFYKFSQENKDSLEIMSFNLRFQNQIDRNQYSWANRRQNCVDLMKEYLPDVIGVQQPKKAQRQFVSEKLHSLYRYYGRPRNLKEDEQSGIYIRRDKFLVIEDGYVWINQFQRQGEKGFGARLPRYFTYLIASLVDLDNQFHVMFVNTHLDHESEEARLEGAMMIGQKITEKFSQYGSKLRNVFVTGDFNTSDKDSIFQHLRVSGQKMESVRYMLSENSDRGETFNGFSSLPKILEKVTSFFSIQSLVIIDHIFVRAEDYRAERFEVVRREDIIYSDHYPILGVFRKQ